VGWYNYLMGKFYRKFENNSVQCELCPRGCILAPGQHGFCFVRQNIDGELESIVYGKCSGLAIDPIEKKPLYHFYPGSKVLSLGTVGCNMGCEFCQNWHLSKAKNFEAMKTEASPNEIAQLAHSKKCKSVAFTYNEPIIFAEYAIDTAKQCHDLDIKTVAVTAGYISKKARKEFFSVMDAVNLDLKAFSNDFYKEHCNAELKHVLDTILFIRHNTNAWLELTTLLIPDINDDPKEIKSMCKWIAKNLGTEVPLHFSAFHPSYKMMDSYSTPVETLGKARKIALACGIKYVYIGNIYDKEANSTWCPACKELLIERKGFELGACNIEGNICAFCGKDIAGCF
jgi:pyruvate formate lyase activating enzyme